MCGTNRWVAGCCQRNAAQLKSVWHAPIAKATKRLACGQCVDGGGIGFGVAFAGVGHAITNGCCTVSLRASIATIRCEIVIKPSEAGRVVAQGAGLMLGFNFPNQARLVVFDAFPAGAGGVAAGVCPSGGLNRQRLAVCAQAGVVPDVCSRAAVGQHAGGREGGALMLRVTEPLSPVEAVAPKVTMKLPVLA